MLLAVLGELYFALAVEGLVKGVWQHGWLLWAIACTPREAVEGGARSAISTNAWSFVRPQGERELVPNRLRLRLAGCELVDGVRFGLIIDIDNPGPVPLGLAIPRVVRPVAFPEFYGETWGFDGAVAGPTPDPNSIVVTECGPGPSLVLEPNDRVARGWILERSPERDVTLDVATSFTQFPPDIPWQQHRELICFRLRAEVGDAECRLVEARESPCHAPGVIHLDVGDSVGVGP
jgi:hypothetical protein